MVVILFLMACGQTAANSADSAAPLPTCGDGVLTPDEQCDDGADNSDTAPDACRTSCRLPRCGDGVVDQSEECDDADAWGGDGCTPSCVLESGALEVEPNDTWSTAQPSAEEPVHASLTEGDVDCFSFTAAECHAILVEETGDCAVPLLLSLHDPSGAAVAANGYDDGGCAVIDPTEEPGARFVDAGQWSVCARGLQETPVPAYTLTVLTADSAAFDIALDALDDADADGLSNACDADRDGDGIENDDDTCPDIPNGPGAYQPTVDEEGFVHHWLLAGPFTGETSPEDCLPSELERAGNDAAAIPSVGTWLEDAPWTVTISPSEHIDFTTAYATVSAPREIYAGVYLYTDHDRDLTLSMGLDDGGRAWLNGEVVLEVSGCQGVNTDQFTAPVSLQEGWNRLMIKVYDQGGGWGMTVRFLDGGVPVTDLEVSASPEDAWSLDQSDADGDGIGDACDMQ